MTMRYAALRITKKLFGGGDVGEMWTCAFIGDPMTL